MITWSLWIVLSIIDAWDYTIKEEATSIDAVLDLIIYSTPFVLLDYLV